MKLHIEQNNLISGSVNISGAKNSAVAVIPAATLTNDLVTLKNIPNIKDVEVLIEILKKQGFKTSFSNNTLKIKRKLFIKKTFSNNVSHLRGSIYFIGAFLSKYKKIKLNYIGGCNLGKRPIDYHINAFKQMGYIDFSSSNTINLKKGVTKSAAITLKTQSLGATINIMLASVLTKKTTTIILNASIEPEVIDTGNFLIQMGANIKGLGTSRIEITGVKKLHGCTYEIINDRIEAGTYLAIGSLPNSKGVTVIGANHNHLKSVLKTLEDMGCILNIAESKITIFPPEKIKGVNITTSPYPGFPTDLNPIFAALLINAEGNSSITETIFENRISHINEFKKLGVNITSKDNRTIIRGITPLKSNNITAYDLRCAAGLILASLQTNCDITISDIDYLFRGYENPVEKLNNLNIKSSLE